MSRIIINISAGFSNSALNIIRISLGNLNHFNSKYIIYKLFKSNLNENLCYLKNIYLFNYILDKGIIIFYKKPFSFTGENLLELIIHGNYNNCKYIIIKIKFYLNEFSIKISKKGEFSKKAFLNKKINILELKKIFFRINKSDNKILNINLKKKFLNFNFLINYIKYLKYNNYKIKFLLKKKLLYFNKFFSKIFSLNKRKNFINIYFCGNFNVGKSSIINKIFKKKNSIISKFKGSTKNIIFNIIFKNEKIIKLIDTVGFYNSKDKLEKFFIKKFIKNLKYIDVLVYIFKNFTEFFNIFFYSIKKLLTIFILNKIDLYFFKNSSFELKFYKKFKIFYKTSIKFNLGFCFFIYYIKKIIKYFKNFINFNFGEIKIIKKLNKLLLKYFIKKNLMNFNIILKIEKYINIILDYKNKNFITKFFKNFCIGK